MSESQDFHTVRGYQLINKENKTLTSAMEDYLEMIYRNSLDEGYIRINVLSELLNVAPSSTTKMVQKLTKEGLLNYKRYGIIFLTKKGIEAGKYLLKRHKIIEKFFKTIGIDKNVLEEIELIEHSVGQATLHRIDVLNRFFDKNPKIAQELKNYDFD